MSNVDKDPAPIDDRPRDTETRGGMPEPDRSAPARAEGVPGLTGIDAFVSAAEAEGSPDILGEQVPEHADAKPLIEAMEALSRGIRKELELARDGGAGVALPAHGGALAPLVEAAEQQIVRMRADLGRENSVEQSGQSSESSALPGQTPAADHLVPLIDVFEAQLRRIRQDLGHRDQPVEVAPPSVPAATTTTTFFDSNSEQFLANSSQLWPAEEEKKRHPWLYASAAALVGVVAVGGWVAWSGRSKAPQAPASLPSSQSASQSAAVESSKNASQPPRADAPAAPNQPAASATEPPPIDSLGTSGSDRVPSAARIPPTMGGGEPERARSAVTRPGSAAIAPPAAAVLPTTETPPASPVPEPRIANPGASVEKSASVETPAAAPPAAGVDADAPASAAGTAPTPAAAPSSSAVPDPVTRPAAVLTRVQPRRLVEVLSGEMSAVVEVLVSVGRDGRLQEARAVSGPVALRAPAEDTVKRWTFSPALQGGQPVDGSLKVTVTFGPWARDMRFRRRSL